MKNQFKLQLFSCFVILSVLLSALGMPIASVKAATTITLDGTPDTATLASGTSIIINHTIGTGTNTLMLVGVSWNCGTGGGNQTISSVTFSYGSTPTVLNLTQKIAQRGGTGTTYRYAAIWYLVAPPSGQAGTVTVTFSASVPNGIVAGVANFAGVDQSTPLGTPNGATASSTAATVSLTGLAGTELVFDTLFLGSSSTSQTATAASGQTQQWNPAVVGNTRGAASTRSAVVGSNAMSWTAGSSAVWAIAAVAINPAPTGTTHDLTVAVNPVGAGTTSPAVGVHTYAEGVAVPVTATAATGYVFDHWGDTVCTGSGACSITMDADHAVTAYFVVTHNLTVAVSPSGGGTTNPAVGLHPYATGTTVPVSATANTGYTFANWTDACTGMDPNVCSVLMDADHTVTANFTINKYALNVTFGGSGGGSVTSNTGGMNCTSDCSHDFDYNTAVILTATPALGSKLTAWGGNCSGTGTCSVTMSAIHNVTVSFDIIPTYTLTMAVDPVGSGTTDPTIGGHTYNDGTLVPVASTAAPGYVFDHWTGSVANVNAASTTVTMGADQTLTAHFTAAPFGYIGDAGQPVYQDATGTSLVITVGSAGVAAGNTIIIGFASRGISNYLAPTITDSKGNAYSIAVCSVAYSHGRTYMAYAPITTPLVSGDLITLTVTQGVTNRVMVASVFSGLLATSPLDQVLNSVDCSLSTTATASNNATVGPTGTTAQADELVIGVIAAEDAGGTTPVDAGLGTWLNGFMPGQTQKSQNTNSYRWRVSMGRYIASAIGTFTAAQTYTNSPYWAASIATFKAAPTGPTCYALTISHTGQGSDPTAIPVRSTGCSSDGQYVAGESITLSGATPDSGWKIDGWTGMTDNGSTASSNTLTMPASDHAAGVTYTEIPPTCYALTISHTGNGSDPTALPVRSTGCSSDGLYVAGESITLSGATPDSGWYISGWTGMTNNASTSSSNSLTMPAADHAAGVTYTLIPPTCYTLTISHTGNGSTPTALPVRSSACSSDGQYVAGASITLSGATPNSGWEIDGWTGTSNDSSTASSNSLNMPASDRAVSVIYSQIPCYALTISHTGNGSNPTATPPKSPTCATNGQYVAGENISLTGAAPDSGWHISGWTGTPNNSSTASTNSLTMPASVQAVSVIYLQTCYTLTISHTGNGSNPIADPVKSTVCATNGQYVAGEDISLDEATPDSGWEVHGWTGTDDNNSAASSNSLTMPASAQAVSVIYSQTCYALAISHTGNGSNPTADPPKSTVCSTNGQYVAGESISLIGAAPDSGWHIGGWTGTINNSSTASTNSLTMPASVRSVSVTYLQTCYVLTISHTGNGSDPTATPARSTSCTTNGQYVAGQTITLSGATPDSGWYISGWTGTTNDDGTASSNTVSMPIGDHAAGVTYLVIPPTCYVLTISHTGNGSDPVANPAMSPECSSNGQYVAGQAISFTGAAPASGSHISGWTGTSNDSSTASSNSLSMPASARSVLVNYSLDQLTYDLPLQVGWNLVSFNLHPVSTDTADVLSSISGKYDLVYAWDAASAAWKKYDPIAAPYASDLENLDETMGFWIKMNTAATLVVSGTIPGTSHINLSQGWNLVSFPASANLALPSAFSDHGVTDFTLVYAYHASDTADPWKLYNISAPAWANDLTSLAPGWGYWVKAGATYSWDVIY